MVRAGLCVVLISVAFMTSGRCADSTSNVRVGGFDFAVPDYLTVERVASAPLVRWPVVADWDQQGRLVVVESGGVGWPIEEHNKKKLHRIVRLIDRDDDGVFDDRILAADELPFTEGVLCLGNSLLAAAPPHIWKLTDRDGDGVCEEREVWFDGQTITGCANDLHGPYLGRDGWVYWCKGAFGEQNHKLTQGRVLNDRAAHVYRRPIEGGPIESVVSGGMDNPVEVAFSPSGEKFFTSTFLQHPGDGRRDGVAHAAYGSLFGKDHYVIDDQVRTGPLMPITIHLGPAAPSGLACFTSVADDTVARWSNPAPWDFTLGVAEFNLHRVSAHRMVRDGASFKANSKVLIESSRIDFHPTDILEDGHGGLLVVDTGGWYDLCCPTSRVDQRIAGGGIYRLRPKQPTKLTSVENEVEWTSISPKECVQLLHDRRPWVRREAFRACRRFGNQVVVELGSCLDQERVASFTGRNQGLRAVWALSAIGTDEAVAVASKCLRAQSRLTDDRLITAACHVVGLHRFAPARRALQQVAATGTPHARRAAAEALGRIGDPRDVDALMQAAEACVYDRTLRHSVVYAMIEIGNSHSLQPYLSTGTPAQQRIAILAMDQIADSELDSEVLFALALSSDRRLRETAIKILAAHPSRAIASGEFLQKLWNKRHRTLARKLVDAWKDQPAVLEFVASQIQDHEATLLSIWSEAEPPRQLLAPLADWLRKETAVAAQAIGSFRLSAGAEPLVSEVRRQLENQADVRIRRQLVQTLPEGSVVAGEVIDELLREKDYKNLARLQIDEPTARLLLSQLKSVLPTELGNVVQAVSNAGVDEIDRQLISTVGELPSAKWLDEALLTNVYRDRNRELRSLAAETQKRLQATPADVLTTVRKRIDALPEGDPVRGLQIFRGAKAACSGCHQMGYVGGQIGPDLTRIGKTRTPEALLEALLFPNARIEQSYRPLRVLTVDGRVLNGLASQSRSGTLELQIAADKKVVLEADEVERRADSDVSIMPGGIGELLTDQQLADILALLESAK